MNVGRIVASVKIENAIDLSKALTCDALVDTGVYSPGSASPSPGAITLSASFAGSMR